MKNPSVIKLSSVDETHRGGNVQRDKFNDVEGF